MFKHILVAVDGSSTSSLALEQAIQLARELQAKLRLLHAVYDATLDFEIEYPDTAVLWEALRGSGEEILKKAEALTGQAGVEAETKLLEIRRAHEHVAEEIAAEADAWPADLIILGTHGRRGLGRLLLGSVAERVARIASKPVLLVRGQ
jgi:nucleotide-binding universal stress UspA family protein